MRMGKDALFRQQDMAFLEALDYLRAQLTIAFSTEDIHEGVKAFFEKREPGMDRPVNVTCLRGRTSDRTDGAGRGAEALARLLGGRVVGEAAPGAPRDWSEDLPASRPVLEAAVAALETAWADGRAARADRLGLLDLHRHAARRGGARARAARGLARRAR